jgi:predicted pyridoxine 5'-phosphate oxidase superfamily flavin-nucleotide-binding protein
MLRVNGVASITADPEIMRCFRHDGKLPRSVVVIETREAYFHCSKGVAPIRPVEPRQAPSQGCISDFGPDRATSSNC